MTKSSEYIYYFGGTAFVIASQKLGYLLSVGDWLTPGIAEVPIVDAKIFEELLTDEGITYSKKNNAYY